jgi:hypothetical protein
MMRAGLIHLTEEEQKDAGIYLDRPGDEYTLTKYLVAANLFVGRHDHQ